MFLTIKISVIVVFNLIINFGKVFFVSPFVSRCASFSSSDGCVVEVDFNKPWHTHTCSVCVYMYIYVAIPSFVNLVLKKCAKSAKFDST